MERQIGPGSLIAVTGATGFIGRHLLNSLRERGYRLRALLRRPVDMKLDCVSAVIGDLARPQNLTAAFAGVDAVIHSAGVPEGMSGVPEHDHRVLNAEATVQLARAAERARVKRFVFLSSIRAQTGPSADQVVTEDQQYAPTDAYGRSKLEAERGLAALGIDWVALRPVLVYGRGVRGNLAALMDLARSPYPLPLAALKARRSLLSVDNLVDAVDAVLTAPGTLQRPLIVADAEALSVPEMIAAMRRGLGRGPGLINVPAPLVAFALRAVGRGEWYERLDQPLVVDTAALSRFGWTPRVASPEGLRVLMEQQDNRDAVAAAPAEGHAAAGYQARR